MTRDEIYDHLAQVYLGKRKTVKKKKRQLNAWLVINIGITIVIFASIVYGLTAFLSQRKSTLQDNVFFALNNGPIHVSYNLADPFPPVKTFSLAIPQMDISKFSKLSFSIRGTDEGAPGIVKVIVKNSRNEVAASYIYGIYQQWQDVKIPFDDFPNITDWTNVTEVSFMLESWNVDKKKGGVLIDNLSFSNTN